MLILLMHCCTWWQPLFLQRRHAWLILLGEWVLRQSRLLWMRGCASCCIWRALKLQERSFRRYRWWMSSWCSLISWRYQFRGGLVSRLCRYRRRRSQFFSSCGLVELKPSFPSLLAWQRGCFFQILLRFSLGPFWEKLFSIISGRKVKSLLYSLLRQYPFKGVILTFIGSIKEIKD